MFFRKTKTAQIDTVLAEQPPIRIKRCKNGLFMYNIHDEYVGRALDVYGEFSEFEDVLFRQIIKPGMTVMDIGANIGVHTVGMASAVGPEGKVIAVEPQRVIFQMLCGNVAMNGIENVQALNAAMGTKAGSIHVPKVDYNKKNNFGGISLDAAGRSGEEVPLITLDNLNLTRCDFIKIDVEGMELNVLQGGGKMLSKLKPILYVENDRPEKSEALIRHLIALNYKLYWDLPPLFNSNNFFGNRENVFATEQSGDIVSVNMLCIPKTVEFPLPPGSEEITPAMAGKHPMRRP